jgi:hypothetical protein
LVHDPASNTATAIIGINNPYLNPVKNEDIICPDVCDQIPWVTEAILQLKEISKGYTFCCTAAELRKAISYAPVLNVPLFGSASGVRMNNGYIGFVTLAFRLFTYRYMHA